MTATPEHVLWAVQRACPFRNSANWIDPEQTARELRPLRAYSEAVSEGRVLDGICVDRLSTEGSSEAAVMGFPVTEIFAMYGDDGFLKATCGGCPANDSDEETCALAGCHGWFEVSDLKPVVNDAVEQFRFGFSGNGSCKPTKRVPKHGFYELWTMSEWSGALLVDAIRLFETVIGETRTHELRFLQFVSALQRAAEHELTMHVKLMPRGRVEGNSWYVAAHCPHCRAEWLSQDGRCPACGFCGGPVPERKRHVRGKRPFVPIAQVVGAENLDRFLQRHNQLFQVIRH